MTPKTLTANTITYTSGGHYQTFQNLNNAKTVNNKYAECHIHGKNATLNRPSILTFKNLKASLPTGAIVTEIKVELKHSKAEYNGKTPNILAPYIDIVNGANFLYNDQKSFQKKAQAPTTTPKKNTVTFKKKIKYNDINDSNFGVHISYPTNANNNEGYLRIYWVRVTLTYKTSEYTVKTTWLNGEYNGDDYEINIGISNKNFTSYQPTLTITAEAGMSLKDKQITGGGTFTVVNASTYTYTPDFHDYKGQCSVKLIFESNVTYASGVETVNRIFRAYESLNGTGQPCTVTVKKTRPVDPTVDPTTGEDSYYQDTEDNTPTRFQSTTINEKFEYTLAIDDTTWNNMIQNIYNYGKDQEWWGGTLTQVYDTIVDRFYLWFTGSEDTSVGTKLSKNDHLTAKPTSSSAWTTSRISKKLSALETDDKKWTIQMKGVSLGYDEIYGVVFSSVYNLDIPIVVATWKFDIRPLESDLTLPSCAILTPTTEELHRLGDGYTYTAQTLMQVSGYTQYYHYTTERSYTLDSGTYKTKLTDTLPPLPQKFTLEFKLKSTSDNCLLFLTPIDYGNQRTPDYGVYFGFSDNGKFRYGHRENGAISYQTTEGSVSTSTYYTLKIERDGKTFKFYQNGTLLGGEIVEWFDNYRDYCLTLSILEPSTVYYKDFDMSSGSGDSYVRDWYKNLRIGVFNNPISSNIHNIEYVDSETGETVEIVYDATDYNSLSIDDILNGADYWSNTPTNVNEFSNLECRFPYNKNYPLYIIIVGDYTEATNTATITYTEPVITETEYYTGRILNGNYPAPINDLVANNGSTAEITIPALNTADTLIFYDLDLDEDYGTNTDIAIRGLQVNTTFQQNTDNLVCYATLVNSKNESKTRSIVLDQLQLSETGNQISIGQIGDLWGYHTQDITNLEDWEIHLTLNNGLNNNTGNANYGDVNLTIYTETVEHQNIKCTIEGEDLSYYGAFITSRTIPEGLKTDTKYINVNGTDTNDPYLQNIREKTIELEFDIGDNCDLEGATQTLRELTRLLVNKRDPYNRPIPKTITFSDYPDVYWEYILENTIEPEIEISSYKVKVKLVVPAGTSYDITPTTTSTTGYISGIASVRPVILIQPTSDTVSITEYHTEQHMNLVYTNEWIGQYVEIDCDNRTATLLESEEDTDGTDITPTVDWNSDWFTIQEEYQFQTTGCNIVSITYQERW